MYPVAFEYLKPSSISEAVALLQQYGEDAKLLAGGQSLVPMMKLRLARPKVVIDIHRIADLNYIREEADQIRCGAMTRHAQIEESELIRKKVSMLCEAAATIGDAQVRNRGTLGGALVEADPAGDYGAVVLALNARMKCRGPRGERVIPATDFFTFAYTTVLQTDEILTEIIFPLPPSGSAGAYLKLERVSGDFAIAGAAVQMSLDVNGTCREIGVGVTGAGTVPQKALVVESLLLDRKITTELIAEAGRLIQEGADPIEDTRGSAAYKRKALSAILRRAIAESLRRAEAKRSA